MKDVRFIVDLQFGSTGKGLFSGYMALQQQPDVIATAWGPNAGHTFINADGRKDVNIALPNGLVSKPEYILIGPGSMIDQQILNREIQRYTESGDLLETRIMIHPHAAVVTESHREREREYGFQIGSTMKGVGEALCSKIRRSELNVAAAMFTRGHPLHRHVVGKDEYDAVIDKADSILVEGCQGYSLGINNGFYPHTTSRECTVQQLMVDCSLPMALFMDAHVYGVARTFPIRVANRFDKEGNMIGTSGPSYTDQIEIGWSDLGREPELTTVTKLPRRIFTWSNKQIEEAIRMNEVDSVFLNFANYVTERTAPTKGADIHTAPLVPYFDCIRKAGARLSHVGWGPNINDIMEV